jgi:phage baseplate assembly protein W
MARPVLSDVGHWFGNDLQLSPTGDLAQVTRANRSRQRVLRRLMTAAGDYMSHPDYGAGLPREIGRNSDHARVRGVIRTQMKIEASVMETPEPSIKLTTVGNTVRADIEYEVSPERAPASLSFTPEAEE